MAAAVLDRLTLTGNETVLDAGCGTGRVTELLVERLPRGRVVAVDADPKMVQMARENLRNRAEVRQSNLLELQSNEKFDAIFSTATFHWILDHERLFERLFAALLPGGRLVAQCGGQGNIAEIRAAGDAVGREALFAGYFDGWNAPWQYAGPEESVERLKAAGFDEVRAWLEPWPVVPDDPFGYLTTIVLGAQVQMLPEPLRTVYINAVMERLSVPVTVGYVRLNLEARRPS